MILTIVEIKKNIRPEGYEIDWLSSGRLAWAPPENITVSQWAERYRILPKESAIPGPWSNRLGPYAVGVMDAFTDPRVERITIMASVQSMKTEAVYNMLGYAISQDPAPALVVMPTLKTLRRVNRRLREMIFASPELSRHLTGNPDDLKLESLLLDRMEIYFATAGSPAELQNVEARYVILDETDEYPLGEGGSPIEMAEDRATTYWNRKVICLSRPTAPDGFINLEYERSDRRKYWVPCPKCGGYQVLSFWQIKHVGERLGEWPKDKRNPEYIKAGRVARYQCLHCQAEIDDRDKPGMLAAGKWVPDGHKIGPDGAMAPLPPTAHVGFWWNVLYSHFKNFSEVAAQFFATKDDREKYRVFYTQWLAEPWRELVRVRQSAEILELRTELPPLTVPDNTVALTAGIDSQKYGFWVVIRAWLMEPEPASHLVRYGFVEDFVELERWLFQDVYHTPTGMAYPVWRAGIDIAGGEIEPGEHTITERVYEWLRISGQGRVFGVKGSSRPLPGGKKLQMSVIDKMPGTKGRPIPGGIRLWHLNTGMLKDSIWARIEGKRFWLHAAADEIYASHLTAEAKERDRYGRQVWVIQGRRANHLLDCEVYAAAMADPECWGGVLVLPRPGGGQVEATREAPMNPLTGRERGAWWRR